METIYLNYSPTFLYVDKYKFPHEWVSQTAHLPYSLLRYVISGSAEFRINGKSYDAKKDSVFYIPQGSSLYCEGREEIEFISIRFTGSIQLQDGDMLKQLWNIKQEYSYKTEPNMKDMFEYIYTAAVSWTSYKRLEIRGYLNLICANLAQKSSKPSSVQDKTKGKKNPDIVSVVDDMEYIRRRAVASQNKADPRIQMLVDYITLHPEKNLTREEMCEMCDVSESTLRRIFKAHMGKTIYEFIKETKLMYASYLLMRTNIPISEIGYKVGYESPSYFTKTFREVFGVSPKEYRISARDT